MPISVRLEFFKSYIADNIFAQHVPREINVTLEEAVRNGQAFPA